MNRLVVLEGLSGAGKTTICRALCKKMTNYRYYKTPPKSFRRRRALVDRNADLADRFQFYAAGILQSSQELAKILKAGNVICDRYILTTLCYHRALGLKIDESFFRSIIIPSHTFLVVCDELTRIQRLESRGMTENDMQERRLKVEQKFLAEYRKHKPIEVDNSSDSVDSAVNQIQAALKG